MTGIKYPYCWRKPSRQNFISLWLGASHLTSKKEQKLQKVNFQRPCPFFL